MDRHDTTRLNQPTRIESLFTQPGQAPVEFPGLSASDSAVNKIASLPPEDLLADEVLLRATRVNLSGRSIPALGGIPLFRKLGQGGMAAVYYGIHPRLNQEVAVKVLPIFLAQRQPKLAQRFLREAQIAARVCSPNLVSVMDVNAENGILFIVMEFVTGSTAAAHVRESCNTTRQGLPEAIALEICIAASEGLAAAHGSGIVHRDVKPENIMVPLGPNYRGSKLADLGLAHLDEAESDLTADQSCMGTPGFIAPEQAIDARTAGKPADIFSMGATLYALLSGSPPFQGETPLNTILATVQQPHTPMRSYRTDLTMPTLHLIERCLEKEPERRFGDGAALLSELRKCLAGIDPSKSVAAAPARANAATMSTTIAPTLFSKTIIEPPPSPAPVSVPTASPSPPSPPPTPAAPPARAPARTAASISSSVANAPVAATPASSPETKTVPAATSAAAAPVVPPSAVDEILSVINASGKGNLPAVARFVSEVCSALHSEQSSGQKITDAILKDVALTTSLLQTVNSAYYTSATAQEITTISRAVLVMGIDTISQIATCLSIVDNTKGNEANGATIKNLIISTLMTGTYSRELARNGAGIQPETAFIAGIMHQLSAVLIAQHFPAKHRLIEELMAGEHLNREQASRRILGASYSEISRAIAKSWNLNSIVGGICHFDTTQPVLRNNRAQKFSAVVSMASDLAEATALPDPKLRAAQIARVCSRYESFVPVNAKRFEQSVASAERSMGQITSAMNVTRSELSSSSKAPLPGDKTAERAKEAAQAEAKKSLQHYLDGMDKTLDGKFDLETVLRSILDVMHKTCGLDHVILMLVTQQKDQLIARLGIGPRLDDYLQTFKIPISGSSGKLAEVITGPREISSDAGALAGMSGELPSVAGGSTFLLLPVMPLGKPIGAVFCQRAVSKGTLSALEKDNLRQLRNRVTDALLKK